MLLFHYKWHILNYVNNMVINQWFIYYALILINIS